MMSSITDLMTSEIGHRHVTSEISRSDLRRVTPEIGHRHVTPEINSSGHHHMISGHRHGINGHPHVMSEISYSGQYHVISGHSPQSSSTKNGRRVEFKVRVLGS